MPRSRSKSTQDKHPMNALAARGAANLAAFLISDMAEYINANAVIDGANGCARRRIQRSAVAAGSSWKR